MCSITGTRQRVWNPPEGSVPTTEFGTHQWRVRTHQLLEGSVNGLLLPHVAVVESNLLTTEKKRAGQGRRDVSVCWSPSTTASTWV